MFTSLPMLRKRSCSPSASQGVRTRPSRFTGGGCGGSRPRVRLSRHWRCARSSSGSSIGAPRTSTKRIVPSRRSSAGAWRHARWMKRRSAASRCAPPKRSQTFLPKMSCGPCSLLALRRWRACGPAQFCSCWPIADYAPVRCCGSWSRTGARATAGFSCGLGRAGRIV